MSNPKPVVRGFLTAVWLIAFVFLALACVNLLVALKTGASVDEIAADKGIPVPSWFHENPFTFYLLDCTIAPGYLSPPFDAAPAASFVFLSLVVVLAGTVVTYRGILHSGAAHQTCGGRFSFWVLGLGAGLLTAGAGSFLLEFFGLWKRLALHPDPKQEQGAPFWFWWVVAAIGTALWCFLLRKSKTRVASRGEWVKRLGWLAVNGLLLAIFSLLLHILRPEPTQGRYYGIAGFVVGRAQNVEYGTYYGMVSGIVVFLIAWIRMTWLLLSAPSRPRLERWF